MTRKLSIFYDCWRYRQFIIGSIKNELTLRFTRSKLGALWVIINPLTQVLIYALILSNVLAAKLPGIESKYSYAIYLTAGILGWSLFNEIITRCLTLFIDQGNLLKKISFPKITLPIIAIGSSLLNHLFLLLAVVAVFLALGHSFNLLFLWLVPITLLLILFAASIGLILGTINVFIRDVAQVVPIFLQLFFWFTPIVYPISIIPESYRWLLTLNPVFAFTSSYQNILVYGKHPDYLSLTCVAVLTIFLSLLCAKIYLKASEEMTDML